MKAPDKIFILPTEMVRYYFTEERIQPAISYIRKDALLEWLDYLKGKVVGDEKRVLVLSIIDKINSL